MRNNYLQSAIKFYWKTHFLPSVQSSIQIKPISPAYSYLCRIYLYFFPFIVEWNRIENRVIFKKKNSFGLRSITCMAHKLIRLVQTVFSQFTLTGISNLEKWCYSGIWSLCLLLARLCHWAYCFPIFFFLEFFFIRCSHPVNVYC